MEDWKLSGWNMKRFHKRRQVVVTQDIKALSLFLLLSVCIWLFLSFLLFFFVRCRRCEWTSWLWGVSLQEIERKRLYFHGCCKSAGSLTFIVIALCSGQPSIHHYVSSDVLSAYLANLPPFWKHQLSVSYLTHNRAQALRVCCSFSASGAPQKGSHQARGSVIYKDYQRNMMSKGKLQLCARPTGRQGWEAAQTEWMYLLFMWKSMGPDRWRFVSSLFTPRFLDKCPRHPSWPDGAQVSRKPFFPFPP